MKIRVSCPRALPFLLALAPGLLFTTTVSAQNFGGPLTPPGPPGATMTTLANIEPRTPLAGGALTAPITITASGSYYLTGNITVTSGDAIDITVQGVTLDLNGFTISSTDPNNTGTAIYLVGGGSQNIHIVNGSIAGSVTVNNGTYSGNGFISGIVAAPSLFNVRVSGVSVAGCLEDGINLGSGSGCVIESCTANLVGGTGLVATTVADSTANGCGGDGIDAFTANNCFGISVSSGVGLSAQAAQNCHGSSSAGDGLDATSALNCYGNSSAGNGLDAITAQNCYGVSASGNGLDAAGGFDVSRAFEAIGRTSLAPGSALNCTGASVTGTGLTAMVAINCNGSSGVSGGNIIGGGMIGLSAEIANGCFGYCDDGIGIVAYTACNCLGWAQGTSPGGSDLEARYANFCFGYHTGVSVFGNSYNMP